LIRFCWKLRFFMDILHYYSGFLLALESGPETIFSDFDGSSIHDADHGS